MTRKIMTIRIKKSTTIVQICPISLVFNNFPSLAWTKFNFLMVPSISPSNYSIRCPCLSSSWLISLPCSFSRLAISLISSRCCSCSSTCCFWKPFIFFSNYICYVYRPRIHEMCWIEYTIFEQSKRSEIYCAFYDEEKEDETDSFWDEIAKLRPYAFFVVLLLYCFLMVYLS